MVGHPKYDYEDTVEFSLGGEIIVGTIYIIDAYGTFFDNSDVSYDILCKQNNTLYKHISEKVVIRKIATAKEAAMVESADTEVSNTSA